MVKLSFFDLKAKKKFVTDKFKIEIRGKRRFAVAQSPLSETNNKPTMIWRTISKNLKRRGESE